MKKELKYTVYYLIFAGLWIGLSDKALFALSQTFAWSEGLIEQFSIYKGWLFVIITSVLMYVFLQKRARHEQKKELDYQRLFDEHPNPMWIYSLEDLSILASNRAAQIQYEYSQEDFNKLKIIDLHIPEDKQRLLKRIEDVKHQYSYVNIWKQKTKTGKILHVNVYVNPTYFYGKKARIVVAIDKTAQIEAEAANEKLAKEIREKENYLAQFLNIKTNFMVMRMTLDGNYSFLNDVFLEKMGYDAGEMLFKPASSFIITEDLRTSYEAGIKCMENPENTLHIEIRKTKKNGEILYSEWEMSAVLNAEGELKELQGIGMDITEFRLSQAHANMYAKRLNDILESIKDGFFTLDKEWKFTYVNQAFEKITGIKATQLIYQNIWEYFPEIKQSVFYEEFNQAVEGKENRSFEAFLPTLSLSVMVSVYPSAEGLTVFLHDISNEKKLQTHINLEKNNLKAIVNNTADMIWSISKDYTFIVFNEAYKKRYAQLFDIQLKEGDAVFPENYNPQLKAFWVENYERAFNGEVFKIAFTYPSTQDSVLQYFETDISPIISDDKKVTGAVCFTRNVTNSQMYLRKIEEQNKLLREIAWIQSHDMRAPIATMLGLVSIFNTKDTADPVNAVVIKGMNENAQKLDAIIQNVVIKSYEVGNMNK